MKRIKKIDFNIYKYIYTILLQISAFISVIILIRYSNCPILKLFSCVSFFIKPKQSDGIAFNLSIGYIVSWVFYIMVVWAPEKDKKNKTKKIVIEELTTVCADAMIMIISMYKNVCEENEWKFEQLNDDTDFFNENFYERMRRLDTYKYADTLKCKNGKDGKFSWGDKLEDDLEDYVNRIDKVINRYIYFLDSEVVNTMLAFQKSKFICAYLGLPNYEIEGGYTGKDGRKYPERVPIYLVRESSEDKYSPIFEKTEHVDNLEMLREYIKALLNLRKLCLSDKRNGFLKDIAIKKFSDPEVGKFHSATVDKKQ